MRTRTILQKFNVAKRIGELYFELDYYPIIGKGIISYGSEELGTFIFFDENRLRTMCIEAVAELTPYMFNCIYNLLPDVDRIEVETIEN